jgi:hypothetical protein
MLHMCNPERVGGQRTALCNVADIFAITGTVMGDVFCRLLRGHSPPTIILANLFVHIPA